MIKGKKDLIFFISIVLVLFIVVISAILAVISQASIDVQRSTEEEAFTLTRQNADFFADQLHFLSGKTGEEWDTILLSDMFRGRWLVLTDREGQIRAGTEWATLQVREENIFDYWATGTIPDGVSLASVRETVAAGGSGFFTLQMQQKEYVAYRSVSEDGPVMFYLLHGAEAEKIYSESENYLRTIKLLGIAYMTATIGIILLMGSFIVFVIRTHSAKEKVTNWRMKTAQNQARTFSNITRVLTQSYEKIYYVDLETGRYKIYGSQGNASELPLKGEGDDFWSGPREALLRDTMEEDRDRLSGFLDKKALPEVARNAGSARIRFRILKNGSPSYHFIKAFLTESDGRSFLVVGLKDVDAYVMYDINQLEEKEAALRRVEVYRNALLDNLVGYCEINVTRGIISEGPMITGETRELHPASLTRYAKPVRFDEFAADWVQRFILTDQWNYLERNTCQYLKSEFDKGHSFVEMNYTARWATGSIREVRQNFYMSRHEDSGDLIALCVLYDMTEKRKQDREIQSLTEELDRSRIKISTSQMQPHFLYNALGSIREIVLEDPQYASDLLCDFTTYLRACVRSLSNDRLIPFSQELENIKAYVNIEKMRFGDRMNVEYDIRESHFQIVPLSVQPLVENAIRHGLYPKKGQGTVRLSTYRRENFVVIEVKDDGVGFEYAKVMDDIVSGKRDSAGLGNLTLRLEKIMKAAVTLDTTLGEGTTVSIVIPDAIPNKEDPT